MFTEGEDVLMRGSDGLMYFGVLVEVEELQFEALVRFGDGTEKTAKFSDLRRLGSGLPPENIPVTPPIKSENVISPKPAAITPSPRTPIYTPSPRAPTPPPPILSPYDDEKRLPFHVLQARRELPYDFDSLIWDANHERNIEEKYCYCGENGVWYKKMLQCQKCLKWFHQECIRNPNVPQLLFGDRFWDFKCTLCTGTTEETVERLNIGWVDALHLILFHLIVSNRKEHHDLEKAIIPLLRKQLKILQPSNPSQGVSVLKSSRLQDPANIESLLKANKSRFKCGNSSKSRCKWWTLCKVGPPLAPHNKDQKDSSIVDVKFENQKNYSAAQQKINKNRSNQDLYRRPAVKTVPSIHNSSSRQKSSKNRTLLRKKDSLDSLGDSSDTSGSLETFIPRPKDFDGQNNPFRTGLFQDPPLPDFVTFAPPSRPSKRDRKRKYWSPPSLGSAGSSPHSSISSLSCGSEPPSKYEIRDSNPEKSSFGSTKSSFLNHNSIEDPLRVAVPVVPEKEDLKWSLNSYFGANHRIARGEKYQVTAKRLTSNGNIEHLMAWDQPITKPFLLSPTSINNEDGQQSS